MRNRNFDVSMKMCTIIAIYPKIVFFNKYLFSSLLLLRFLVRALERDNLVTFVLIYLTLCQWGLYRGMPMGSLIEIISLS